MSAVKNFMAILLALLFMLSPIVCYASEKASENEADSFEQELYSKYGKENVYVARGSQEKKHDINWPLTILTIFVVLFVVFIVIARRL